MQHVGDAPVACQDQTTSCVQSVLLVAENDIAPDGIPAKSPDRLVKFASLRTNWSIMPGERGTCVRVAPPAVTLNPVIDVNAWSVPTCAIVVYG